MLVQTSLETLWQDFRYGARVLRKGPAFALTIVGMLAIGIGANTTIFSVVNAVVMEPLPYKEPGRLIRLSESNPGQGGAESAVSAPNFKDWQSQQSVFEQLAALELATFNLTGVGEPERLAAASVTANLIPALGVTPLLGRSFLPEEEIAGRNRVVLLSYGLWQRQFGGDQTLLNKTVQLNGESYTVIGIMPADFQFPGLRELWVPLALDPAREPWRADRSNHNLSVFGRLGPNVTLDQAIGEMNLIAQRLEQQFPKSNTGWGVRLRTFYDWIVPQEVRRSMLVLFVAVGLVLLIACANVANLLLARARKRERETAISAALGASRARLMRQQLIESLLLAGFGALVGLLLAMLGTRLITLGNTQNIARLSETRIDLRVLGFTLVVSAITALVFGLAPAWSASQLNLTEALREGGRSEGGRMAHRLRFILVVTEITLALALLVNAGLMMRSFVRLQAVPLGFAPENVLTMQISLPGSTYGSREQRVNFFDRLLERLRSVPGVIDAGAVTQPPSTAGNWTAEITLERGDGAINSAPSSADARAATPNYFGTMGIKLLEGREFTEQDRGGDKPLNLIVSETFARRYWPNDNPIGKRFRPGTNNPFGTVVGIVGDVRNSNLQEEAQSAFYFPYGYIGMPGLVVVVRTIAQPETLATAIRAQVREVDSQQPVYNIRTMKQIISNATAQPRFQTVLLSLFSTVALLLAAVGIYGLMAYLIGQRGREIAIRMALGAGAPEILKMVIGQGMRYVLFGVVLGLAGSFALARLMKSFFFGVSSTDPFTLIMVALLLIGVAFVACYLPALRATKVNPSTALRQE